MTRKDGKGHFISLGNSKAKNDKYKFSTEITVRDSSGKVMATLTDGLVTVLDPRAKEDANPNLPPNLFRELFIVTD